MPRTPHYLSLADVAVECDLKPRTARGYYSEGKLPEPDWMFNGQPGWLPRTIATWKANRPKRGNWTKGPDRVGGRRKPESEET